MSEDQNIQDKNSEDRRQIPIAIGTEFANENNSQQKFPEDKQISVTSNQQPTSAGGSAGEPEQRK